MSSNPPVTLFADSLLSKWGFHDGDLLEEIMLDLRWDHGEPDVSSHAVLDHLVRTRLMPAVQAAGYDLVLRSISTIHNPIRAETVNGVEVDWGDPSFAIAPEFSAIHVHVTFDEIAAAMRHVAATGVRPDDQ